MERKVISAEVKEVKNKERTLEFTGSTEAVDRMGDVIEAGGWNIKDYKKNPVFLWAHKYNDLPIGKATRVWVSADKQLKFQIEFADRDTYEFADTVYRLYQKGFLNAVSVGFEPKEWEDMETKDDKDEWDRGKRYKKQDLLELSAVPVPANPEALQDAVDSELITIKEFHAVTKPEETEEYIRIPVAECTITATIDISKKEGIKALYCGKEKKVATYLFDKDKWTMAEAQEWVDEHKGKSVDVTGDEPDDIEQRIQLDVCKEEWIEIGEAVRRIEDKVDSLIERESEQESDAPKPKQSVWGMLGLKIKEDK